MATLIRRTTIAVDIKKLAAKAKQTGRDFTKTVEGGGEGYTPPAAGPVNLRFVGYFEIGRHKKTFKGQEKQVDQVQLVFELSGKQYPAKDGVPLRMTITESLSNNVKANIVKLFNKMNYKGEATHFAELLGEAYRGRIIHTEKEADGKKTVYANLRNDDGYTIMPPTVEQVDDEGNVTVKPVKVAPPITELKLFLWDNPDMEQWASIYIEGEYPEQKDDNGKVTKKARTKNVIQAKIKSALNWEGSPMHQLLTEGELGDPDGTDDEPDGTNDVPGANGEPADEDDDPLAALD